MILVGLLGVVLLLIGFQHTAGIVRPHAARTARVGACLRRRRRAHRRPVPQHGIPRWVPACWAPFLPLDLFAAGVVPVDPHWLFLAGGRRRRPRRSPGCREGLTDSLP